jgi:hypothetical protein
MTSKDHKHTAILAALWEKNHSALIELAKRTNAISLCLRNDYSPALASDIAANNGLLVNIQGYQTESHEAASRADITIRLKALESSLNSPQWGAFCQAMHIGPLPAARALTENIAISAHQVLLTIEALDKAAERYDIALTVLNDEYTLFSKLLLTWSHSRGIPVLHVLHGTPLIRLYNVHEVAEADFYAVGSSACVQALEELQVSEQRIRKTGYPVWDRYAELRSDNITLKQTVANKLKLKTHEIWITLFTTWHSPTSAFGSLNDYSQSIHDVLRACSQLWASGYSFKLIIKDRPQNQRFGSDVVNRLITAVRAPPEEIRYTTAMTPELVSVSDLVLSIGSNITIEATIAGTNALNICDETSYLLGPPFANCGVPECESHEIHKWLLYYMDHRPADGTWSLSPREFYVGQSGDGLAGVRLAECIQDIAGL